MANVLILHGNSKFFSNTRWFTSSKAWEHQICCLKLFHPCHCFSQLRGVISKIEILLQSKMCSVSRHNPHACATIRPKKQTTTKFEEFSFTHICETFCSIALVLWTWSAVMVCGTGYFSVDRKSRCKKARDNSIFFCERDSDASITSVYPKNEWADKFSGEWHQPARKKVKPEAQQVIRNKHSKKQRRRHSTDCVVLCQRRCASFWLDLCFPHAKTHGSKMT